MLCSGSGTVLPSLMICTTVGHTLLLTSSIVVNVSEYHIVACQLVDAVTDTCIVWHHKHLGLLVTTSSCPAIEKSNHRQLLFHVSPCQPVPTCQLWPRQAQYDAPLNTSRVQPLISLIALTHAHTHQWGPQCACDCSILLMHTTEGMQAA